MLCGKRLMPLQFDEICNQWNMIDTNLSSRLRKTVSILTQKKGGVSIKNFQNLTMMTF
jgi:hypothetical protein